MSTKLETEKVNQSILDHIILGVAHEINNPNAFVRMNMMNIKKMINLLRPCLEEYEKNHPGEKFGPYSLDELRSKLSQLLESTLGATVRIITVADKLKQCTSFALSHGDRVSLVEIVKNVIEMHRFLIEKWAKLEFIYDENTDYSVDVHRLQLEQAFSILITNACDAIGEKFKEDSNDSIGGVLTVSVLLSGDFIQVSVKDNGMGIDNAVMPKIFKPYFTTKPQGVGDGMGLPLCLAVIERHNGKIDVKSERGVGSEFTICIPRATGEANSNLP